MCKMMYETVSKSIDFYFTVLYLLFCLVGVRFYTECQNNQSDLCFFHASKVVLKGNGKYKIGSKISCLSSRIINLQSDCLAPSTLIDKLLLKGEKQTRHVTSYRIF